MAESFVKEKKCPNCGAPLRFDPQAGMLICDYCDSRFEVSETEAKTDGQSVSQMDFQEAKEALEKLNVYICRSCGAEIICDPENVALTCPYCGNNIVLSDKVSGSLVPDGIIPFSITPDKLAETVRSFYKDKKLLPKNFLSDSSIGKVQGIYVPFWIYNTDVNGDISMEASVSSSHRQGDYRVTEHRYFQLDRNVSMRFENMPVDASRKMDDALMDSLEPYDFSKIVGFDPSYLAGYLADRFDLDAREVKERADERMQNSAMSVARSSTSMGYVVTASDGHFDLSHSSARYVLLPAYIFSVKYNDKEYSFGVNGQTGQVVGELPTDKSVKRAYFWKSFLPVALGIFAALWFLVLR